MAGRFDRVKVEVLLTSALRASEEGWSEDRIVESFKAECMKLKSSIRSWPHLFEMLKMIVRHSEKSYSQYPVKDWPSKLLEAAGKDRFLYTVK